MKIILELIATVLYMTVIFPLTILLHLLFMILVVLTLPLHIPVIKKRIPPTKSGSFGGK